MNFEPRVKLKDVVLLLFLRFSPTEHPIYHLRLSLFASLCLCPCIPGPALCTCGHLGPMPPISGGARGSGGPLYFFESLTCGSDAADPVFCICRIIAAEFGRLLLEARSRSSMCRIGEGGGPDVHDMSSSAARCEAASFCEGKLVGRLASSGMRICSDEGGSKRFFWPFAALAGRRLPPGSSFISAAAL